MVDLRGSKVDDGTLLAPAEYTIVLSPGGEAFEGTSRTRRYGGGTLRGSVSVSP